MNIKKKKNTRDVNKSATGKRVLSRTKGRISLLLKNIQHLHFNSYNAIIMFNLRKGKWYTSDRGSNFHLYSGFSDAISNSEKPKIDIFGLTLSYNEKDGSLFLKDQDYKSSKKVFPGLSPDMKVIPLAWVGYISGVAPSRRSQSSSSGIPCNAEWSNIFRVDLEEMQGKCLHFTAASSGTIYVVFSASPKNLDARYVVEISSERIVIFKVWWAHIHNVLRC